MDILVMGYNRKNVRKGVLLFYTSLKCVMCPQTCLEFSQLFGQKYLKTSHDWFGPLKHDALWSFWGGILDTPSKLF